METFAEYITRAEDKKVIRRTRGATIFELPNGDMKAVVTCIPQNFWQGGEWMPITARPDRKGNFEGSLFGYNPAHEVTYKRRSLSAFKAVIHNGRRIKLNWKQHTDGLRADLPFGHASIVFDDTGVRQFVEIPERIEGLLFLDDEAVRTPRGLRKGDLRTLEGLRLSSRIDLSKMAYPLVIDPDYGGDATTAGTVTGFNATYATARATSTSFLDGPGAPMQVSQYFGPYQQYRLYIKFLTTDIFGTITAVTMTLTCAAVNPGAAFDVQIIKQDWSAQDPLSNANREAAYDNALTAAADSSIWRNTAGLVLNTTYASGALSTAWVNKTASTYYSLISSKDKSATAPVATETVSFYDPGNVNVARRPYLNVTLSPKIATAMPVLST